MNSIIEYSFEKIFIFPKIGLAIDEKMVKDAGHIYEVGGSN